VNSKNQTSGSLYSRNHTSLVEKIFILSGGMLRLLLNKFDRAPTSFTLLVGAPDSLT
jgi:hypothetical protein